MMLTGGAERAPMLCRACYGVLRFIMESGAKGCEVIVSGKLRAQRAKAMKFKDGYMIASGQPVHDFIDSAVRHVLLRQGVLGIKVSTLKVRLLNCANSEAGCKRLSKVAACKTRDACAALFSFASTTISAAVEESCSEAGKVMQCICCAGANHEGSRRRRQGRTQEAHA